MSSTCSQCGRQPESGFALCDRCRTKMRERAAAWRETGGQRERRRQAREAVLAAYGGHCACCGEGTPEFLTIDHINGVPDRHRYRRSGRRLKGTELYLRLVVEGFPDDCQLLCFNCNNARAIYGTCPHEVATLRAVG